VSSMSVAGVDRPVADDIKVLGVVLDWRLSFHKHVSAVARSSSCSYHVQAIRHIPHLLTTELAQTLACSLILSRIDYCNAVLHGAPSYSVKKLQRVQNNAARIVLEALRRSHASPLLRTLHWLPVQQRIDYRVALLTFKVRSTSTPSYLRLLIQDRETAATCDRPLWRCVKLSRRQHLRNVLFDALRQLSGTHYRKLFSVATLLQFLSLG